jgi:sugar O-acyltransferase (sialic acid O-acetyltransferase NeuD family)
MACAKVVLLGAGGFAREVVELIEAANGAVPKFEVLGYLVDAAHGAPGTVVGDRPILGDFDWLAGRAGDVRAIAAVGAPALKRRMVAAAAEHGVGFATVVHPGVVRGRRVRLGDGVILAAGCVLTTDIEIGDHAHVNLGCTVGHDVRLEPFVTVSPGAHLSGNVVLEEGCFIGTGANIIERRRVGRWAVVGAASGVMTDVPANSTVVGIPARVLTMRPPDWQLG